PMRHLFPNQLLSALRSRLEIRLHKGNCLETRRSKKHRTKTQRFFSTFRLSLKHIGSSDAGLTSWRGWDHKLPIQWASLDKSEKKVKRRHEESGFWGTR